MKVAIKESDYLAILEDEELYESWQEKKKAIAQKYKNAKDKTKEKWNNMSHAKRRAIIGGATFGLVGAGIGYYSGKKKDKELASQSQQKARKKSRSKEIKSKVNSLNNLKG